MMDSSRIMAITLVCIIFSIHFLIRKFRDEELGKKYYPIGGTSLGHLMNFNRMHDYLTEIAAKHKTFRLLSPFRSKVYTTDPVNVEYILKEKFEKYAKGLYNCSTQKDLFGEGIFAVDGQKWQKQRKVASHEFSTRILRDYSSIVFKKNTLKLANIVSEAANSKQAMDVQDLFMKSTLDSIAEVAFGVELDSLSGLNEEATKFGIAFDDASMRIVWRHVDLLWKIKKALNIGSEAKLKENIKVIDEYVYKMIHRRTEQMKKPQNYLMREEDILSRFMQSNPDADPMFLRDIIMNFMIAGKDTTAIARSWFFCMLCKHPKVQEKVAQEIRKATSHREIEDISQFAVCVTEEALEKMHYLHAALTETLRLYPSIPVDTKECLSDDTMPDGYCIKKGDSVTYLPYAMGRMKFIWGDDAEEFRPERWLNGTGCFQHESPYKFIAFQAGPRLCLGKEFAYRQMKIVSAILLRFYTFRLHDEEKRVKDKINLTLPINGGTHRSSFSQSGH